MNKSKFIYLFIIYIFISLSGMILFAQDTFSIVAVDPETGEVGGAGASCLPFHPTNEWQGARIISEIVPGLGVIHAQSLFDPVNKNNAKNWMEEGLPPTLVLENLIEYDVENDPSFRQYGIVDLVNGGRSAAFTGENCIDYKGHITGKKYSIQGNILLGPQILDSMEVRFLNTSGSLADRLMAALKSAKVPGADSRCLEDGVSSRSAFIRVARKNDSVESLYLDLNVEQGRSDEEPIDLLDEMYNKWKRVTSVEHRLHIVNTHHLSQNVPNPFNPSTMIEFQIPYAEYVHLKIIDILGREVVSLVSEKLGAGRHSYHFDAKYLSSGIYYYVLITKDFKAVKKMILLR